MDDLEQIKQLKARYFRFIDSHDWSGLVELFAPDAEIDTSGEGGGAVTRGAAEFVTRVSQVLADVTSVHHGHMPEIELLSPTTARGVWAMEDKLWWPAGSPISHLHGYGHYHETYAKVDGRWVITSMRLDRIRRDIER